VRHGEVVVGDCLALDPENVDVDRPRLFLRGGPDATELRLDSERTRKDFARWERSQKQHGTVDEVGLGRSFRRSLIQRRDFHHVYIAVLAQMIDRLVDALDPIPHVRAESQNDSSDVVHDVPSLSDR